MMQNNLIVAPAPHITKQHSTNILMFAMIVALLPTAISGVINFGYRAIYLMLLSVVSAYGFDMLFQYLKERKVRWLDLSSVVTGLITALILPVNAPLYFPILAAFIAVVIFKGLFGGLGRNFLNPSAAARLVLGVIFSGLTLEMFVGSNSLPNTLSPLYYFQNGDYATIGLRSLFLGSAPGAFGTASSMCVIIAGVLLMLFGVTDFIIPICSVLTFTGICWLTRGAISIVPFMFSGSFLFATFFMVTDPTTSPNTVWGKLVYGLLFGVFAGLMRVFFVFGESGVFVAVLAANLLAPLLDKIFAPHPIGAKRRA